ncbi:hypothetical protein ACFV9Q_13855, partial [Promicromonospora sp. NPDC059942]
MSTRVEPVSETLLVERVVELVLGRGAPNGTPARLPAGGHSPTQPGRADAATAVPLKTTKHPSAQ